MYSLKKGSLILLFSKINLTIIKFIFFSYFKNPYDQRMNVAGQINFKDHIKYMGWQEIIGNTVIH